MKNYKLIVFDWDGTLYDSAAQIVQSMQKAIEELNLEHPTDEEIAQYIGLDPICVVESLFPDIDLGKRVQLKQRFQYYYYSNSSTPCLFNGTIDRLKALHAQGFTLAIATGKSRAGLNDALVKTGLSELISLSRTADETACKPNPQMLLEIMDTLQIAPEHTLMVGDTEYDLLLAKAAGTDAVAVTHGVHDTERLKMFESVLIVDNLQALKTWLQTSES